MSVALPVFFFQGNRYLKRSTYGRAVKVLWFSSTLERHKLQQSSRQHLKTLFESAQMPIILNYERDLIKRGLGADLQINRMLLEFYSSKGDFEASSNVFNRLSYNATVTDTTAWMKSFLISGESTQALNTLRSLFENKYPVSSEIIMSFLESTPHVNLCNDLQNILRQFRFNMDIHLYNSLLQVYTNDLEESEKLFKKMKLEVRINPDTYAILIQACINTNDHTKKFEAAERFYKEAISKGMVGKEVFQSFLSLAIQLQDPRLTLQILDDMMIYSGSQVEERFLNILDVKSNKPLKGSLRDITILISDFIDPRYIHDGIADALCFLGTFHFELHELLRSLKSLDNLVRPTVSGLQALEKLMKAHHIPNVTWTTIDWGEKFWLHLKAQSRITSPTFEQTWTNCLCRLCFLLGDTPRATELLDTCFGEVNGFTIDSRLSLIHI